MNKKDLVAQGGIFDIDILFDIVFEDNSRFPEAMTAFKIETIKKTGLKFKLSWVLDTECNRNIASIYQFFINERGEEILEEKPFITTIAPVCSFSSSITFALHSCFDSLWKRLSNFIDVFTLVFGDIGIDSLKEHQLTLDRFSADVSLSKCLTNPTRILSRDDEEDKAVIIKYIRNNGEKTSFIIKGEMSYRPNKVLTTLVGNREVDPRLEVRLPSVKRILTTINESKDTTDLTVPVETSSLEWVLRTRIPTELFIRILPTTCS